MSGILQKLDAAESRIDTAVQESHKEEIAEAIKDVDGTQPESFSAEEGKKWRYRSMAVLLTYKTHIPKQEYKTWILETAKINTTADDIHIAHEKESSETAYEHSHVFIKFSKQPDFTDCRKLDYNGIHPNWYKPKSKRHQDNMLKYLAKEDPECAYLKQLFKEHFMSTIKKVIDAESNVEALYAAAKKPSDVTGILAIRKAAKEEQVAKECQYEPVPDADIDWNFFPWYTELKEYLLGPAVPRKILWFVSSQGDRGKSYFITMMLLREESRQYVCKVGDVMSMKGMAQHIHNHVSTYGKKPTVLIFNIPASKSDESTKHIYRQLETIKDGSVCGEKYTGHGVSWNPHKVPHVIVFANIEPDYSQVKPDRWIVRSIDSGTIESQTGRLYLREAYTRLNDKVLEEKQEEKPTDVDPILTSDVASLRAEIFRLRQLLESK